MARSPENLTCPPCGDRAFKDLLNISGWMMEILVKLLRRLRASGINEELETEVAGTILDAGRESIRFRRLARLLRVFTGGEWVLATGSNSIVREGAVASHRKHYWLGCLGPEGGFGRLNKQLPTSTWNKLVKRCRRDWDECFGNGSWRC